MKDDRDEKSAAARDGQETIDEAASDLVRDAYSERKCFT